MIIHAYFAYSSICHVLYTEWTTVGNLKPLQNDREYWCTLVCRLRCLILLLWYDLLYILWAQDSRQFQLWRALSLRQHILCRYLRPLKLWRVTFCTQKCTSLFKTWHLLQFIFILTIIRIYWAQLWDINCDEAHFNTCGFNALGTLAWGVGSGRLKLRPGWREVAGRYK